MANINLNNEIKIKYTIKNATSEYGFKKKIKFFRKNKSIHKQDIHDFFIENDDDFYYYQIEQNNKNTNITFIEFYSNNIERFYNNFNLWIKHIEDTYKYENSWCLII